jgi:predicted nucleic acid-binding protein
MTAIDECLLFGTDPEALPDPDDEAFAQLALEAKVGYLVTCNLRHFPSDRLPALRVVSPKDFLQVLQSQNP